MLKRGSVYLVNLGDKDGSIQWGKRPAIIVSNDLNNKFSSLISIVPITSSKFKKHLPTHVAITTANSGIEKDSIALCEQTMVIPKEYILKEEPLFILNDNLIKEIEIGMMIQLGLTAENMKLAYAV